KEAKGMGQRGSIREGGAADHHEKAGVNRKPGAGAEGKMDALGKKQEKEPNCERGNANDQKGHQAPLIRQPAGNQ
ncbi:MAG: hypothetical protein RIS83_1678, partial [Pseudomonadota bacterium]